MRKWLWGALLIPLLAAFPLYTGSISVPSGATATFAGIPAAAPSVCLGLSSLAAMVYTPCTSIGGVTAVTTPAAGNLLAAPTTGTVVISLASPAAAACPSSVAGFSSAFALQFQNGCAITTVAATGNLTGGGTGPTPAAFNLASPAATACPSSVGGYSATYGLTYTVPTVGGNCPAFTGQSKTAFSIMVLPTATALATPVAGFYTRAFQVSPDLNNPTVDGASAYCDTAGSGGSATTFQFYETFGATPTFATSNPIATTIAFTSASAIGGAATFPATALPTSTTPANPTWVFAVVKSISTTAPSGNCSFELHGLQRIIQ